MDTSKRSSKRSPGQAQTLRLQGFVNALMRGLLSTPGVAKGIGRRMILLYVVGRKTGKRYSVPIAYHHMGDALVIGSQFGWVRNLRTGDPIEVRYKGERRVADVEVIADEEGVVEYYAEMCRMNHAFARFHRVRMDKDNNPDPGDLRLVFKNGGRVVKLLLR